MRLLYEEMLKRDLVAFFDVDSLKIGNKVQEVICEAIKLSPFFLVVLSHEFKGKQYPEAELEVALAFNESKTIVPIFYRMTADQCGECNIPLYPKLSSYTGLERGSKEVSQFASDVADEVKVIAETQRDTSALPFFLQFLAPVYILTVVNLFSLDELKVVTVPKYIRKSESDLDPLWHLKESLSKKQESNVKGTVSDAFSM